MKKLLYGILPLNDPPRSRDLYKSASYSYTKEPVKGRNRANKVTQIRFWSLGMTDIDHATLKNIHRI